MQNRNDHRAATILLVEDEAFVREVTREILESAGYRVLTAKVAAEAARILDQEPSRIDLLLTDIVLPDESGRVLAENLLRRNPCLKVLYVSGYPEQIRMLQDKREDCLPKPYSSEALVRKVEAMIEHSDLHAEEPLLMQVAFVA